MRSEIGVFYIAAVARPESDISTLPVRLVLTLDVESGQAVTRNVQGITAICDALQMWMIAFCTSSQE